ncbi:MAG TPA: hypothetical protein VLN08_11535 [Vicinamibacterales bacterium]|nr:hypothetical protein [Vicinamibacterales bacterium]
MNASRAALMVVGVNLVAVWAAAAAGSRTAATESSSPPQLIAGEAVGEARASLLAAAERLEAHARRNVRVAAARDPFRFGAEARPAAGRAAGRPMLEPREEDAAAEPRVEPEPDIVLQGMAESEQDGVLVRTAILRAGDELVLASIGMRIGDRYDVVALSADSVELEDTLSGERRTWRLK